MQSFRSSILFLLLFSCTAIMAQSPVRLVDPTAILGHASIASAQHAITAMQVAGLDKDLIDRAKLHGDPAHWPAGWRNDSARKANEHILVNVKAYSLCTYTLNEQPLTIVHVPAIENFHMPEQLRSADDFYFIVRNDGLGEVAQPKAVASEGPNWRSMPKARITVPAQVYATYDLGDDEAALGVLAERGLSKAEIDAVIFRSHERNWPEGIDAFEKRHPKLKHFKKFKAHMAARWGDKVLVVIPAELNKNLPPGLRPYMDIYMVYTSPAVAVMKK